MNNKQEDFTPLEVVGLVVIIIYEVIIGAFIATKFYEWFVFGKFINLPILTLIDFIGFKLFLNVVIPKQSIRIKAEFVKTPREVLIEGIFAPLLILLIGYLAHLVI